MEPTSKYLIYALVDPRDGAWRYIGKTEGSLKKRFREHWCRAYQKRTDGKFQFNQHVYCWIRSLGGRKPKLLELEESKSHETLISAEIEWIAEARRQGIDLTNKSDGGEGCLGYKHTPEVCRGISERNKGRPSPNKGVPMAIESRLLVSQTKTGLTREQQDAMVNEYLSGDSCNVVADRYGVTQMVVFSLMEIFGHPMRTQAETMRKIKPDQETILISRHDAGETLKELATSLGVSPGTISHAIKRGGGTVHDSRRKSPSAEIKAKRIAWRSLREVEVRSA